MALQDEAAMAFRAGDFALALEKYSHAENVYRQAVVSPGDRVFFMQISVLRCLEQLLDDGDVSFARRLGSESLRFFEDWTPGTIRSSVHDANAGDQAMAILAWRESFQASLVERQFQGATALSAVGDFDGSLAASFQISS